MCTFVNAWWSLQNWIDNGAHGIEELLLNTQVSEDFAQ